MTTWAHRKCVKCGAKAQDHQDGQRPGLSLTARSEGKLKSYESCSDLRAWSHDLQARDRYLREWMKSDMPVCVISIATLASLLEAMTYKNRGKVTPRCHPNCRSRLVLESICASCHAMKDCLKEDAEYEKYFEREDFETCHWPCERCLDALKSIKMFWRVIVEKVFRIRVPKTEESLHPSSVGLDSVRNTAKMWQNEMVHHARTVRSLKPFESEGSVKSCQYSQTKGVRLDSRMSTRTFSLGEKPRLGHSMRSNLTKLRDNEPIPILVGNKTCKPRNTVHRYISVKVKKADVGCDTCELQNDNNEYGAYVNDFNILQDRYKALMIQMQNMKRENTSLKFELHNLYDGFALKSHSCKPAQIRPALDDTYVVPKPYDYIDEIGESLPNQTMKTVDSEIVITMKNCYNPNYKNVSLLQVLHKSNTPHPYNPVDPACRREDPTCLLRKIQTVFGAIVSRELGIVSDVNRGQTKASDIDASFHRVTVNKSVPSCSTLGCPSTIFGTAQTTM